MKHNIMATLLLVFSALLTFGSSVPTDTVPPLKPPRPPQNAHLAPHIHLNRSESMMLTNLVIFIRFADEEEFTESIETIDLMFNDTTPNNISVYNYYEVMTYGKINYHTVYTNNIQDTAIISYQDAYPRSYYQPQSSSNPDGYSGPGTANFRKRELLAGVMQYVDSLQLVDSTTNLDGNDDGKIDNISFIIKGDIDDWDDLLWPQMDFFDTVYLPITLNGKTACAYNLEFAHSGPYFTANTFCHEMGHSLGLPDLYHYYYYTYITPVYIWDMMGQNNLQQVSAILKYKFLGIVDEPVEITEDGHYVLNSVTSSDQNNCYFIRSALNPNQWYTLEYRNCDDFMENVPQSGVIIGRWNDNANLNDIHYAGNAYFNNTTIQHTYWIFRPSSSSDTDNGIISQAAFGNANRTAFGPNTNPHPYLTSGTPETSFEITNIQYSGDQASFDVHFFHDGIQDYGNGHITLYPNPAQSQLFVNGEDLLSIEICDLLGRTVLTSSEIGSSIDVSSLESGVYLIKITSGNGISTQKFVKQ